MLDPERRSELLTTKLRALARQTWSVEIDEWSTIPGGVVAASGGTAFAYLADDPVRRLGAALAWALRHDLDDVQVLVDPSPAAGPSVTARRAALFAVPVQVWEIDGVDVRPAEPAPPHEVLPGPTDTDTLEALLATADVEVVVEHGRMSGELLGLEVARIEPGPDGVARLVVGVGRHDREAFPQIHGDLPAAEALAIVVASVAEQRRPDSTHPFARLASERWLRRRVIAEPALVGADALEAVEPTLPRGGLDERAVAMAVGRGADGPVMVACSVGIDLDAVPAAADARLAHAPDARLVLVVPERDAHPLQRRLAAALRAPAELRAVPGEWR